MSRWYPKVNMMRSNQKPCDPFLKSSPRERCKPALPSVRRLNLNHLVLFNLRFSAFCWPKKVFSYISETFWLFKQPGPFMLFQLAWLQCHHSLSDISYSSSVRAYFTKYGSNYAALYIFPSLSFCTIYPLLSINKRLEFIASDLNCLISKSASLCLTYFLLLRKSGVRLNRCEKRHLTGL